MILIIDNYDSFTYNLVQLFESRGEVVEVYLNDAITISDIRRKNPDAIVLSPGPCTPKQAGICLDVVVNLYKEYPIFGVCLGHQVIGASFGAEIVNAGRIQHGKVEHIQHMNTGFFQNIQDEFIATRYHSLIICEDSLSDELMITARAKSDGMIMAIEHKVYPVYGVQFHPESYGTECGIKMADNFIKIVKERKENIQ